MVFSTVETDKLKKVILGIYSTYVSSLQAKNKKDKAAKEQQTTTGAQDRAVWVELMWKIAYPVIHNLAENTLRQNMPIESPNGNPKGYDEITHLEAVGRTLAGVAPWLSLPDDDTEEDSVVSFFFTFKNEPPHTTERKDGTANSVLSLAVLGIERKAFQGFLQLRCHKSAHINPKLFRLYKHLFLHHC